VTPTDAERAPLLERLRDAESFGEASAELFAEIDTLRAELARLAAENESLHERTCLTHAQVNALPDHIDTLKASLRELLAVDLLDSARRYVAAHSLVAVRFQEAEKANEYVRASGQMNSSIEKASDVVENRARALVAGLEGK